jgi:hypothetical protein
MGGEERDLPEDVSRLLGDGDLELAIGQGKALPVSNYEGQAP